MTKHRFAPNQNFINGHWHEAARGEHFLNCNPANIDDCIGAFPRSRESDVSAAATPRIYSFLNATIGFTRVARSAGTKHANAATTASNAATRR